MSIVYIWQKRKQRQWGAMTGPRSHGSSVVELRFEPSLWTLAGAQRAQICWVCGMSQWRVCVHFQISTAPLSCHHAGIIFLYFYPLCTSWMPFPLSNPNAHKDIFKKFISLPLLYKKALLPPSTADDGFMAIKSMKLLQSVDQTLIMP